MPFCRDWYLEYTTVAVTYNRGGTCSCPLKLTVKGMDIAWQVEAGGHDDLQYVIVDKNET
jgi:hypothetical protein